MDENFQENGNRIKIIIAEDQGLIMHALSMMIEAEKDFEIIGKAAKAEELLSMLETRKPDVILMDIKMPGMTGIEVTRIIDLKMPWIKIIALSMYTYPQFIREMLKAGAKGFLSKDCLPEELYGAIRDVCDGKTVFCKTISEVLVHNFSHTDDGAEQKAQSLTSRELELIHLLSDGLSTKEIAAQLFISDKTVERHKSNILKKMNVHNTAQLVKTAVQNGMLIR